MARYIKAVIKNQGCSTKYWLLNLNEQSKCSEWDNFKLGSCPPILVGSANILLIVY